MKTSINRNGTSDQNDNMVRFILDLTRRLHPSKIESVRRGLTALAVSNTPSGPLFDFMGLINPNMPQNVFSDVVTGILANTSRMMSSKAHRMNPSSVKLSPPIGAPVPSLTFTDGDIDDILMDEDGVFSGDTDVNVANALSEIKNLKRGRSARRRALLRDPKTMKFVKIFGSATMQALARAQRHDSGFLQELSNILSDIEGKERINIRPKRDYYPAKVSTVATAESKDFGEGGIPAAVIAGLTAAGKFIVEYGPLIYAVFDAILGTGSGTAVKAYIPNGQTYQSYDKSLEVLARSAEKAKLGAVASNIRDVIAEIKAVKYKFTDPKYSSSNAIRWRELYAKTYAMHLVRDITIKLQAALAKRYMTLNSDQPTVSQLLIPKSNVPLANLMQSVWDPNLIQDEDQAWKDFKDYAQANIKANPLMKNMLGNLTLGMLEGNFKNGSSSLTPGPDLNPNDGWDDVSAQFIKTDYVKYIAQYIYAIKAHVNLAYDFSTKFDRGNLSVTLEMMFPGGDYSGFKPWDVQYMNTFYSLLNKKFQSLGASSKEVTTNVANNNVVNNQNQVVTNEVVNDNQDVNPSYNNVDDPSAGTILITPNETIVGLGHYVDPATGKVTDYSDLFELGRAATELKRRATLMVNIPSGNFYGDPLEGGLFGLIGKAAGFLGKKLLKVPAVAKFAKKIPILKNFVKSEPNQAAAVAANANATEASGLSKLLSLGGALPNTPGGIEGVMTMIKSAAESMKGIDAKMDTLINSISQLQLNTLTAGDIGSGDIYSDMQRVASYDPHAQYPLGAILQAIASGDINDLTDNVSGDVDLWRIVA